MNNNFREKRRAYRIGLVIVTVALLQAVAYAKASTPFHQLKLEARSTATQTEVHKLEAGTPIERELRGGESHTYEIVLQAEQFLNMVVEQRGIDVVVEVIGPDGKQLMEVDSPNGTVGPEPLQLVTKAAGVYRVVVRSLEQAVPVGKYEIKVYAVRAATEYDRTQSEVAELNKKVEQLIETGNYDEALPLAQRALTISEKGFAPDHPDLAVVLNNLALLNNRKGDYDKAERLYQRSLVIRERALGPDHFDVAQVIGNLGVVYFAHPYHSWERGLNENTNGLVRQYFPKGSDFTQITDEQVQSVAERLNERPRKTLGYQTPNDVFFNSPPVALRC
jgi:tetratricopeptide (TPR) repeat protein